MAGKAPRKSLNRGGRGGGPVGAMGLKSAPRSGGPVLAESDEEKDLLDTQQFSVKFDDQAECEKKSVKNEFLRCLDCSAILTTQSKILTNK